MAEPTLARVSPKLKDLTGRRFGRLIVIGLGPARSGSRTWLCRCECGNTKAALSGNLRSGKTKSCGCIRVQANQERNTTHGLALTPEYRVWLHIKGRCHTPTDANYQNYGGRGISVCQRWRDSFESFYSDMGPRPSARHSIDRVDNNGNYEPGNCRWATKKVQCRNQRTSRLLTFGGKTMTAAEWGESGPIPTGTILMRIYRGWSVEAAIVTPLHKR
jgi:hypothetical protein